MYQQKQKFQNLLLMIIDAACIVASYLFVSFVRLKCRPNPMSLSMNDVVGTLWLVFLAYFCVFIFFNMNQYLMQRDKYEEFVYVIKVNIFMAAVLAVIFFLARQMDMADLALEQHKAKQRLAALERKECASGC